MSKQVLLRLFFYILPALIFAPCAFLFLDHFSFRDKILLIVMLPILAWVKDLMTVRR